MLINIINNKIFNLLKYLFRCNKLSGFNIEKNGLMNNNHFH